MKFLIVTFLGMLVSAQVFATEITPERLIGHYTADARVLFQKVHLRLRVLTTTQFQVQRIFPNGNAGEICDGTFTMTPLAFLFEDVVAMGQTFRGIATCPSNRSENLTFNLQLVNKTMEDLEAGTNVSLTTSLAPGRIDAYVKKQP
ncbi:MAG: hypothetical protein HUU57_06055 [Bdellovibrio sp.]|nr:hypothetical protein [Bdellovibrio sp.]